MEDDQAGADAYNAHLSTHNAESLAVWLNNAKLLADAKALDEAYASAADSPAEAYNRDLWALVQAARDIAANPAPMNVDAMLKALEQFEPWLEQDEDPRSMGWVDDKGRP